MKRIISTILVMCIVVTAVAAFTQPAAEASTLPRVNNTQSLRLNHGDIEQLVRRHNPIIDNNRLAEAGLHEMTGGGEGGAIDAMVAGQGQLIAMQAQTGALLAQIMAVQPEQPDPVREGIIMSLMNDMAATERDIMQISSQIEHMSSDPVGNSVTRSIAQINAANRQVIWGVESLYLGYHTLNNQLNQTRENLDSLSRNIALMERRHAVGHVTARALQNARSNRTQLEAAIANMENELENLKGQVNLMLGRNFDAPLVIGNLPEAERDFMRSRDRARDLRSARNASVAISTAEMDINEQTSQWGENARRQEAMARNNLENEERTLSQRHASLIRAISDRQTNLELAEEQLELLEQTLEETQRRFNRGLVSRVDFEQAQTEVALQEIRVSAADAELFGAIRRYEWFIRGLNI